MDKDTKLIYELIHSCFIFVLASSMLQQKDLAESLMFLNKIISSWSLSLKFDILDLCNPTFLEKRMRVTWDRDPSLTL